MTLCVEICNYCTVQYTEVSQLCIVHTFYIFNKITVHIGMFHLYVSVRRSFTFEVATVTKMFSVT